jgi:lipid-binding SYLF domain-containing protein
MIWNANHVLDQALSPDTPGIPRGMIKNCKGIILLSVVEAGFIFSGNVGTGVIIGKSAFVCFVI